MDGHTSGEQGVTGTTFDGPCASPRGYRAESWLVHGNKADDGRAEDEEDRETVAARCTIANESGSHSMVLLDSNLDIGLVDENSHRYGTVQGIVRSSNLIWAEDGDVRSGEVYLHCNQPTWIVRVDGVARGYRRVDHSARALETAWQLLGDVRFETAEFHR